MNGIKNKLNGRVGASSGKQRGLSLVFGRHKRGPVPVTGIRRLVFVVFILSAVLAAVSCGSNSDPVVNGGMGGMTAANDARRDSDDTDPSQTLAPARYTEHLVCELQQASSRWQHLYRLDLQRPGAEFVGGQGGRFATLYSQAMAVSADWVTMTFDPSSESKDLDVRLKGFQVQIHRSTLVYRWFWRADPGHEPRPGAPDMQGRCALLHAKHFAADPTA